VVTANQINPGMIVSISNKLFRVESSTKVALKKGAPFVKTKLRNLSTDKVSERNFKLDQEVKEVALAERTLEFLYPEGKGYLFLDLEELNMIQVPEEVVGQKVNYLKEGTEIKATFYGDTVFSVELPPFLELTVAKVQKGKESQVSVSDATGVAILETGAEIEVPPFIEVGDIVKVDCQTGEFVQRV